MGTFKYMAPEQARGGDPFEIVYARVTGDLSDQEWRAQSEAFGILGHGLAQPGIRESLRNAS